MARIPKATLGAKPPDRLAVVPPQSYHKEYVERSDSEVSCYDTFDYALGNNDNVLITGPSGSGKTMGVLAYASLRKFAFYSISSSVGLEPSQLFGRYIPDGFGGFVWQDGPVTFLVRHGGVLLINEINFIPDRVGTVLFSLLDKRRSIQLLDHKGEVLTAHKDLLVVADMNPGYVGTRSLNAALRNRFAIQLEWGYDKEVEEQLVSSKSLRAVADRLRASNEVVTPVGTNMLMEFMRQATPATGLGYPFAVMNFVNHFQSDEQPVVNMVMDTFSFELRKELVPEPDAPLAWNPDDYDLSVVGTADNPNPLNYPEWTESQGIYNVDWRLSEDDDLRDVDDEDIDDE